MRHQLVLTVHIDLRRKRGVQRLKGSSPRTHRHHEGQQLGRQAIFVALVVLARGRRAILVDILVVRRKINVLVLLLAAVQRSRTVGSLVVTVRTVGNRPRHTVCAGRQAHARVVHKVHRVRHKDGAKGRAKASCQLVKERRASRRVILANNRQANRRVKRSLEQGAEGALVHQQGQIHDTVNHVFLNLVDRRQQGTKPCKLAHAVLGKPIKDASATLRPSTRRRLLRVLVVSTAAALLTVVVARRAATALLTTVTATRFGPGFVLVC
mmetsp:Transcript_9661/g.30640  ORF Transcript_9661/g.30640 Transcript_9661/m.30640 type:complete len:267 (-) Transcript_9661:1272-2072(-)